MVLNDHFVLAVFPKISIMMKMQLTMTKRKKKQRKRKLTDQVSSHAVTFRPYSKMPYYSNGHSGNTQNSPTYVLASALFLGAE